MKKQTILAVICFILAVLVIGHPTDKALQVEKAVAAQADELFELQVYSGEPIYKSTDKIRIWATLKYVGSDRRITLWHGEPGILFTISDGNELEIGGIKFLISTSTTLKRDTLYTYDCQLYVDGDEPIADYWRKFSPEKGLFLPEGDYEVKAVKDFSLREEDINPINISSKITIKVVE